MAAAEIIEKLTRHGKTVAVAESCTGGMICSMLVEQAGASACFAEGYVTYSNDCLLYTSQAKGRDAFADSSKRLVCPGILKVKSSSSFSGCAIFPIL